jgi:hypothetical protein
MKLTKSQLKEIIREEIQKLNEKSKEAKMVLQLMDSDYEYSEALKKVLGKYKNVNKARLEAELNKYI